VTGDGLDDLILGNIYNRLLRDVDVYPALASGGYGPPVALSRPVSASMTSSLAVGDFNGDGRGDLMLDEGSDTANLHLYLQDSQGRLVPTREIARERGAGALIVSDLDRDGRTDLSIAHIGWGYIGYYLQTPTGLAPETVINAYQFMARVNFFASGDLNSDGCGDLVVSRGSQSPVFLYGQGCPRPRIANCRLPPTLMVDAGPQATGPTSPAAPPHSDRTGAYVAAGPGRTPTARPAYNGSVSRSPVRMPPAPRNRTMQY